MGVLLAGFWFGGISMANETCWTETCDEWEFCATFKYNDQTTENVYKCTTNKKIQKTDFPTCDGWWFNWETMAWKSFAPASKTLSQNTTYLCNTTEFYSATFKYNDQTTAKIVQSNTSWIILQDNIPECDWTWFLWTELNTTNMKLSLTKVTLDGNDSVYTCNTKYSAQVWETLYESFENAVTAANWVSIITLLKRIEYTMSENETLIVNNYSPITVNAPEWKVTTRAYTSNPKSYTFTIVDPVAKYQNGEVTKYYDSLSSAISAATDWSTVTLLTDHETKRITLWSLSVHKSIILDLWNNTLDINDNTDYALLMIHPDSNSSLTIKNWKIIFNNTKSNKCGLATQKESQSLILESTVTLEAKWTTTPLCVFQGSVTTEADITSENTFAIAGNWTANKWYEKYTINIDGGDIKSTASIGIYQPNWWILNINWWTIEWTTAVYAKAWTLNINWWTLKWKWTKAEYSYNWNWANSTADALVVDSCGYPGWTPTVNITVWTLTSTNNKAIWYYIYWDNENPTVTATTNDITLTEWYQRFANWNWYKISKAVTISFKNQDSDFGTVQTIAKWSKAIRPETDPVSTEEWKVFAGWYKESWLINEWNFDTDIVNENVTLYAKFNDPVTVTFMDWESAYLVVTIAKDTKTTQPDNPVKEWYTFDKWTNWNETNAFDFTTSIDSNLTLNANWTVNQYTITFNTDWWNAIDPITQDYWTAVIAPANPTKSCYSFAGWDKVIPITMPAEDTTITAKWTYSCSSWGGRTSSSTTTKEEKTDETKTDETKYDTTEGNDNTVADNNEEVNNEEETLEEIIEELPENYDLPEVVNYDSNVPAAQQTLTDGLTPEMHKAYVFSFKHWITTMPDAVNADMYGPLNRIAMDKMLVNYAINVLHMVPDTTKEVPVFPDVDEALDAEYGNAVTLWYQLWIMWINIDNFRPYDEVPRWEFGTALWRMLFGLPDGEWAYYETHLKKLMDEWIITNDNPYLQELRGYVMIMLMRSATK